MSENITPRVRVRFAPSPTGPLHLGGVRTALYDYLFARHHGGDFVLRIEDTDTARFVPGAEEYIMESLEWAGIIPDESPKVGGAYGPYRQSERREIYDRHIEKLLETGDAYKAFDTPEELDVLRAEAEARGEVFSYDTHTRLRLRNSLSLSAEEVQKLEDEGVPFVIRYKMPVGRILNLSDLIRGNFSVSTDTLDDKVLVKNDGMPTYHFANVVDDYEMKISHVIRGEEWLPSLPLHILLYETMGWTPPEFAHLSLILKPEGKGKLSKRDGDKFGFPVFPLDYKDPDGNISIGYREQGYLPEAFINMLALLGWNPGEDREILSLKEMIKEFSLNKVHKAGARFNQDKARWFQQHYLQKKTDQEVLELLRDEFPGLAVVPDERLLRIISLMKERAVFVKDIYAEGNYFFQPPSEYAEKAVKKAWTPETAEYMTLVTGLLEKTEFKAQDIHNALAEFAQGQGIGMGKIMMPLRLAMVGDLKGPDVPLILEILGREQVLARLRNALSVLG